VLSQGKGNMQDPKRVGSVYYNLGVINGILNVEAVRTAQKKFSAHTTRGSIQKPNTGKKLKMPPTMSNTATASRAANDDGFRNQRMN